MRGQGVDSAAKMIKRVLDILVASIGLVFLSPLLVAIAIWIKLDSSGPAFHLARRMGCGGKLFTIIKFRSMYVDSPPVRNPDRSYRVDDDDPRVTGAGRVLRLGFDELPQLINVFKGEMSLVGPRPEPPEVLQYYRPEDRERLQVRPGITGLAQISGRNDLPWHERLVLDREYVRDWSLKLDAQIAFYTLFEFLPPLRRWLAGRRAAGWTMADPESVGEG